MSSAAVAVTPHTFSTMNIQQQQQKQKQKQQQQQKAAFPLLGERPVAAGLLQQQSGGVCCCNSEQGRPYTLGLGAGEALQHAHI